MDKFDKKIIEEYSTPRFQYWKEFLTPQETAVFALYYFEDMDILHISLHLCYSEAQIKRILKSARRKIFKRLP